MQRAVAQSARDAAKEHVGRELDKKKSKDKPKPKRNDDRSGARTGDEPADGERYTLSLDDPQLVAPTGPKLPRRLFPHAADFFAVDFELQGAYRGWLPQQYESAEVAIAGYATWRAGVKGKFFKHLSLYRGYYESNGLSAPRNTNASIAAKVGGSSPKAAKALAYVGLSFWRWIHPIIRYEARSYATVARPQIPVCIVGRNDSVDATDCPRTTADLEVISSFESLVAGVRLVPGGESRSIFATPKGTLPPFYVGLGVISYGKPYQINVDGAVLEEFLFDSRFRGAGLVFGTQLGGGARRFFADVDLQLGLGEVQLTNDFSLSEVTPDDWLIGYIQGNLRAGYWLVVVEGPPTVYFKPTLGLGGASFHFVSTSGADSAPSLNWDLLWSAQAALVVAL